MANRKKFYYYVIPLLFLAAVISVRIGFSDKTEAISRRVFDRYQTLKPRIYKETPVRFVDIDDESLQKLGQWPWPRIQLAQLVTKLTEKGAAVIVMDILFAEADRTSPSNILPLWNDSLPELKALQAKTSSLPDHDQIFAKAISESRVVTGITLTSQPMNREPLIKAGFAHSGEDPLSYLPVFRGAILNLAEIEKEAAGSGSFNFLADSDGVLRRVPLIFRYQNQLVPSLVAESVRVAQGASSYVIKSSGASGESNFGESTGITSLKIGQFVVPTDSEGKMWLYDTGKVNARYLSAWKVLADDFDTTLVEGNILFVGSSAAGLKDLRTTPLSPISAGTEVHVQLTEQILNEEFLNRPDWAPGAEMFFLLFLSLGLIFFLPRMGAILAALFSLAAIAFAFGFSWHAFTVKHWLFDPVTPSLAALLIYLTVSFMNYLRTEEEKNQIRSAFGQYVSPALLEKISKHPEQLKLGGEIRPMTILFADIRNFTAFSEQYSAEELTHFMNRYLTPMTDIILKGNGTIDKYIGDCIMAFWNAPLSDPLHAANACQAALDMQQHLNSWNLFMKEEAQKHKKPFTPLAIGIGLNTGECCVGNMGSDQRFDYSVLGDDVNLASRLESQSKYYRVDTIVGQNTREQAKNFAMLELDLIRVTGKQKSVKIFTLLGGSQLMNDSTFQELETLHQNMITSYREQKWKEAEKLVESLLQAGFPFHLENFYKLYQERIRTYQSNPPGPSWDGIFTATSK